MKRPSLISLLQVNGPVLWTWVVAVALAFGVQVAQGLGQPSQGLALSSAALPALLVALAPIRFRRAAAAAMVAALALLAVSDAAYHRLFQVYLPLRSFLALGQGWRVRDYAVGLLEPGDAWMALAAVGTVVWAVAARRTPRSPMAWRWRVGLPATLAGLGSLPALAWAVWVSPGAADSLTGGFLYAHLADARRTVAEWRMAREPSPGEWSRVQSYIQSHEPSSVPESPWAGAAQGSNLLLLQVEALNQWLLDADVEGEPVMPFLRELARRSLSFTGVFDVTHQGRSSDADYLVMASQHPLERDAVSMVRPTLDPVALPDLLRDRGYATFSAHAHIPGFWNSALRHERYGFQESLFEAELGAGETLGFGLTDQRFMERTLPHLARLPQPWMAWLITLTMHGPHGDVPTAFHTLSLGPLDGTPLGNFFLKARHTDDAIRALVDSLDAQGILDATTLVVFGDHTERHRFDMAWVHRAAGVDDRPADVQDLLLDRVPFLVTLPGTGSGAHIASLQAGADAVGERMDPLQAGADAVGGRMDTAGSLLDVAPTLLHLLGLPPSRSFLGRSLLTPGPGMAAQASGEVVAGDLMWTGSACYAYPQGTAAPHGACQGIIAQARDQLEVSWLITRHGLSQRLTGAGQEP